MSKPSTFPPRGAAVMPPSAVPLASAIESSAVLARLGQRLRESRDRLATATEVLPGALRPHVVAGPCDERQWVLLAANGAVAAKLRQCLPTIEQHLQATGWPPLDVRIRVQQR